jgi:hypothetical protein
MKAFKTVYQIVGLRIPDTLVSFLHGEEVKLRRGRIGPWLMWLGTIYFYKVK